MYAWSVLTNKKTGLVILQVCSLKWLWGFPFLSVVEEGSSLHVLNTQHSFITQAGGSCEETFPGDLQCMSPISGEAEQPVLSGHFYTCFGEKCLLNTSLLHLGGVFVCFINLEPLIFLSLPPKSWSYNCIALYAVHLLYVYKLFGLFYVYRCFCLHVCLCTECLLDAHGGQLELEL